jgi:hypothetical protein
MEKIATQCRAIDIMANGGLATGTITQIFGEKALGKSLVSFQAAYGTAVAGNSAIILDTEQSYHSYLIPHWRDRMAKRFGKEVPVVEVGLSRRSLEKEEEKEKPRSERKKFVPRSQVVTAISGALNRLEIPYSQSQLESAVELFASDLFLEPLEVKEPSVVVVEVPEVADLLGLHGVEGEKAVSEGHRVELHLLRTPSYHSMLRQMVKDADAKLVLYDSISAPFKSSFPSTQDLPARSASLSMMLSHAQRLCVEYDIAVLAVAHVSVNPVNPWIRRPYGGAILGYEAKFSFELTGGGGKREERAVAVNPEDETDDAKRVWLARHPAEADYSRYGYMKIDAEGVH